jgi:hypothetical protein
MPLEGLIKKQGVGYGPATLKAITIAFDEAWAKVEHDFEVGSPKADAYRTLLANAILFVAKSTSTDPEILKHEALAIVAITKKDDPLDGPGA